MDRSSKAIIWIVVVLAVAVPLVAATFSPLHQWRSPVYIAAGFAGILALILVFFQPLLAANYLPGLAALTARRVHRLLGPLLVLLVVLHVLGLWITSPPDVIDALLLASPTPFSMWGVIAMWCVFASAVLATLRRRLRLKVSTWRITHKTFAVFIVLGSVVHALLIEGTMELISKVVLCALIVFVAVLALTKGWRTK